MLSAYDLSGDPLMLERATELGDWLLPSLGTQYGLAINRYTLGSNPAGMNTGRAVLSEVGSLTMEFTRLSMLTGNEIYYQAVSCSLAPARHLLKRLTNSLPLLMNRSSAPWTPSTSSSPPPMPLPSLVATAVVWAPSSPRGSILVIPRS
jgi:hypothetical protein